MRHPLKTLALAAAVALAVPAASLVTLTVIPSASAAATPAVQLALAPNRCLADQRTMYMRERSRLMHQGYRNVRFAGYYRYRPRCFQAMYFAVCRGYRKYRVVVRYRFARPSQTFRTMTGICRRGTPGLHRHKRAS